MAAWFNLAWVFRPWAVALCVSLVIASLALVLTEFAEFRRRLPEFHQFSPGEPDLPVADSQCDQDSTRVRPRVVVQALRGECHQMGMMLLVFRSGPVLRRLGRVDDAEQVAPHHHRRGGNVRGNGPFSRRHLRLVEYEPGLVALFVFSMSFSFPRSRRSSSMQPADALRRLFHAGRLSGDPNLRPKADKMLADRFGW